MTKIVQQKLSLLDKQIAALQTSNQLLAKEVQTKKIENARKVQAQFDRDQASKAKEEIKSALPGADYINTPSNPVVTRKLNEQVANMNIVEADDTIPNDLLTPLKDLPSYNERGGGWVNGQIARGADVYFLVSQNYILAYNRSRCYLLNQKIDDNQSANQLPDILIKSANGMGCPSDVQGIYQAGNRDLSHQEFLDVLAAKPDYDVLTTGYVRFQNHEQVALDISMMKMVF